MKFRCADRSQAFLLPPSLDDWLPSGHLARFVCNVVEGLDLGRLYGRYGEARDGGAPAYDPKLMLSLLFYAYCAGIWSSRKIERATYEDVAFRFISGNSHPDHDSICAFRALHISAMADLFVKILLICRETGLVKIGDVVVDGTKILASASGQKTMSYERLCITEQRLRAQVEQLLRSATEADAAEDAKYGVGNRGDELPKELSTAKSRLAAIEAAKSRLEERARSEAAEEQAANRDRAGQREKEERQTGKKKRGRAPAVKEFGELYQSRLSKLQVNVTDTDSRLMQDGATKAIVQAYNCQTVVDSHAQIIVAASATTDANDKRQLIPMLAQAAANLGEAPKRASADAGYYSMAAVTAPSLMHTDLYVSPSRAAEETADEEVSSNTDPVATISEGRFIKYTEPPKPKTLAAEVADGMRAKLRTDEGKQFYRARGAIVEGPFGQIKEGRGFRRLSMRGLEKADGEWNLVCLTHNLLKMWRSGLDLASMKAQEA